MENQELTGNTASRLVWASDLYPESDKLVRYGRTPS
jgi:hypothetical protein